MAETILAEIMRQLEPSSIFIAASDTVSEEGKIYSIDSLGVYDIVCHPSRVAELAHELSEKFTVRLLDAHEFEQRGKLWTVINGLTGK